MKTYSIKSPEGYVDVIIHTDNLQELKEVLVDDCKIEELK